MPPASRSVTSPSRRAKYTKEVNLIEERNQISVKRHLCGKEVIKEGVILFLPHRYSSPKKNKKIGSARRALEPYFNII